MIEQLIFRIAEQQGFALINVAGQTVRSVSISVMGTAVMQAILSVFGFAIAGVPGSELLGLFCLILAMMQIGIAPIWIPTAIWLGYHGDTGWAIFTVVWGILINNSDNIVKPYLISKGSSLPIPLSF